MGLRTWLGRRRRGIASTTALSVLSSGLLLAAALSDGVPAPDVLLHDGSVWVTNADDLLLGRLNRQIDELTSGLRTTSSDFDVVQDGAHVLVHDRQADLLRPVDVAYAALTEDEVPVPDGAVVALGGSTVAVLAGDGSMWVRTVSSVASLQVATDPPDVQLGRGALHAVGMDGTVYGLSVRDQRLTEVGPDGSQSARGVGRLPADVAGVDLTVVGQQAVVLDREGGRLLVPGGDDVPVPAGVGALLQQPGPGSGSVLLSTPSALLEVPLAGGALSSVEAGTDGRALRPVRVGRCAHAAWSGSLLYAKRCGGSALPVAPVPGTEETTDLQFRVNRDVVVLNGVGTGGVWLLDDRPTLLTDDWDSVTPPEEQEGQDEQQTLEQRVEDVQAQREQENVAPDAVDDDLGVRAGRSTLLPLLDNDTDADGDVITVQALPPTTPVGALSLVSGGVQVQLDVPPGVEGTTATFDYTVSDGRGGTDTARVTVTVRLPGQNGPPAQLRPSTAVVAQGKAVSTNVLGDFRDPDGDDLVLVAARPSTPDSVTSRADGTVSFVDSGATAGRKDVDLEVSDGVASGTGRLSVDVRAASPQGTAPEAVSDHVVAYARRAGVVEPLSNDTDPDGDELRLAQVAGSTVGLEVTPDYASGTFTVLGAAPGTHYLTYVVTDGPNEDVGLVRVDVLAPDDRNRPPIAVRDVALLPQGGRVLVDVLANDEDPDGDVLVVQSLAGAREAGLTVATVDHAVLRITAAAPLPGPVTLQYTASDGQGTAIGSVTVVPVRPPAQQQPPIAVPDVATVRAGDLATIPVLANDSHPDGDELTLVPSLDSELGDDQGLLFADGQVLRYQAPAAAMTVQAVYTVEDSLGQRASTQVTLYVRGDDGQNASPQPLPVVARTLAGSTVRIDVPLAGTDPDGDSVTLIGVDTQPTKGRVVDVGPTWLSYEAYAGSSGTDVFRYAVRDRFGLRATADISVGIAPRTANQPPVPVDDLAVVRTGRSVTVSALANDTDPDGDAVRFGEPALLDVPAGVEARISGDAVVVRPGPSPSVTVPYVVEDGRAGRATGFITIEQRDDARLLPPVARDDVLVPAEIADRSTVDVPVLANDDDPDGPTDALRVGLSRAAGALAEVRDGGVRVRPTARAQTLAYSVTDADGGVAWAFVFVPGTEADEPTLRPGAAFEVREGQSQELDLASVVDVRAGRTPRLTAEDRVSATGTDGSSLVVDQDTLRFTPAPGYAGPASLTFEVTDGAPQDDDARVAVLTLPVTVVPTTNRPPVWNGASAEVAAGGEPVVIDVARAATDLDRDALSFVAPAGLPPGIRAALSGTRLTVSAEQGVADGTTGTVDLTVTDGASDPVPAPVAVRVVATTRPLPKAVEDRITVDAGRSALVDVLANDANPYPEVPLRLVAPLGFDSAQGAATIETDRVRVAPASSFVGTMLVLYQVQDGSDDVARRVEGRLLVTVRGRPGTPPAPSVLSVGDGQVTLTWAAPAANGAPITVYTVSAGAREWPCPTTTCAVTGLTNGTEYRFRVSASNEAGTSDVSAESAPVRPDVRPDRPEAPAVTAGDGTVQASWSPPRSASAVSSYDLEISPAAPGGSQVSVSVASYTFSGLVNGQSYQVRVRARSSAPDPSDWSDYSQAAVPAGAPLKPAPPSATATGGNLGGQVAVSWSAPGANGAPIDSYRLQVLRDGAVVQTSTHSGSTTSTTVAAENSSEYRFVLAAVNRVGTSSASDLSAPVQPFGQPGRIAAVTADERDRSSRLTFTPPADGGKAISRYEYRVNSGVVATLAAAGTVTGLTNGTSYQYEVRACNDYCGEWSPSSNAVSPYGPPGSPDVSADSGASSVTFTWFPPAPNGRLVTDLQVSIGGGAWQSRGPGSNSETVSGSPGQTVTLAVRAVDAAGQIGQSNSASGRVTSSPSAVLRRGVGVPQQVIPAGQPGYLYYYDASVSGFPASTLLDVECWSGSSVYQFASMTTNSAGAASDAQLCEGPSGGEHWVVVYPRTGGGGSAISNRVVW